MTDQAVSANGLLPRAASGSVGYLDPTDKTYAWQKKGAVILNQVLPRHENHPGKARQMEFGLRIRF